MWKGAGVIGGNGGGIRKQRDDGENGFLVSSIDEAAERMVQLLKDKKLRERMGKKARETVERKYLLTRHLENYIDLFNAFETTYRLRGFN
jgi:trehalose synthase